MKKNTYYKQFFTSLLLIATILVNHTKTVAQDKEVKMTFDQFYDEKPFHFGFLFGFASSRFTVNHSDSIGVGPNNAVSVLSPGSFAFILGGIANLSISKRFDLKSGINLALYERFVRYNFRGQSEFPDEIRESAWIEIPLLLKYKSNRRRNSRMYMITGAKLGIETNVKKSGIGTTKLDTKKSDISFEYGFGYEKFLQYFKFTPELRFSFGLTDMFNQPNSNSTSPYSVGIKRLSTNTVTLLINFE